MVSATKARNGNCRSKTAVVKLPLNIISRFQRWDAPTAPYLGRWPRLLHFAPLALRPAITDRPLRGLYLDCFMNDPRYRASYQTGLPQSTLLRNTFFRIFPPGLRGNTSLQKARYCGILKSARRDCANSTISLISA